MAAGAAKDAALVLDNVTGTAVDISAYLTGITFAVDGTVIDITTLGDTWHDFVRGQNNASLSVEGIYDTLPGTLLYNLATASASATFSYGPQGTASGKPKITGECFMTSFSPPAALDEAVTFSAAFQTTGAVTYGTF